MHWILKRYGVELAGAALLISQLMARNGCRFFLHQPEIPEKLLTMQIGKK